MIIIIDGYNVLKRVHHQCYITEQQRAHFIKQLNLYAYAKSHSIVLVFDGGPSFYPMQENCGSVSIVYSGIHQSADEYIKQYIQQQSKKTLLIVSSDRSIVMTAMQHNALHMDAQDFYVFLQESRTMTKPTKHCNTILKISEENNPELDALMVSIEPINKKEESEERYPRTKRNKASKEERKLLQKIKKL